MANSVTIHGGQGGDTISFAFTVTGTQTTFYATQFATNVNALLAPASVQGGGDTITHVSPGGTGNATGGMTPVYLLDSPPTTPGGLASPSYTIANAGYVLDTISGGATIAITGNDTVLVAAVNAQATINGAGADNKIIFVTGENVYNGTADTGGDTLVGGSGSDTIYTSKLGQTTVNPGTGQNTIVLQDTTVGALNDFVWLDDGRSTVQANGVGDVVIATLGNQIVDGSTVAAAGSDLRIELTNQPGNSTVSGNDLINANATDSVYVFDYSTNNTVNGGSGVLRFIAGDSIAATVHGGTGSGYLFGGANDTITLGALGDTAASTGSLFFVSGGNETLNGAANTGTLYAFGGGTGDSLVGGTGFNVLTASTGSETLVGGTGTNYFNISDSVSAGAHLVLSDFSTNGSSDLVLSGGFTQGDVATIETAKGDGSGNLVVSLHDGTQLTFTGITSGSQLTGHIILQ